MKNERREMKRGDYLAAKEEMRKPAGQPIVVMLFFIIVFISVILRLAVRS